MSPPRQPPQSQSQSRPQPPDAGIFLYGLGCASISDKDYDEMEKGWSKETGMSISFMCNKEYFKTVHGIYKLSTCQALPRSNDVFLKAVYTKVLEELNKGPTVNVYLAGHSYGGAVVAKVAEKLQANIEDTTILKRIHVATLGSIYIPKTKNVNKLNIVHYMHMYDISLLCNSLQKRINHHNKHIIWIKRPSEPYRSPMKYLGIAKRWKYHNDGYDNILSDIFHHKNILLSDRVLEERGFQHIEFDRNYITPVSFREPAPEPVHVPVPAPAQSLLSRLRKSMSRTYRPKNAKNTTNASLTTPLLTAIKEPETPPIKTQNPQKPRRLAPITVTQPKVPQPNLRAR